MTRIICIAGFSMLLFSIGVMADPSSSITPANVVRAESPVKADTAVVSSGSELLLVKEQNKMIKEFQSSQQTTVYWALSAIMGFVVVLSGLSYFTNFKFYEQDKERIKSDFESRLVSSRAEMNVSFEEFRRELSAAIDQNNQLVQDRVLLQLSEVRASVENFRLELSSEIKGAEQKTGKLESKLKSFEVKFSNSEIELREVEMEVWEMQGVPSNMLLSLSQALRAAADLKNKHSAARISNKMLGVVQKQFLLADKSIKKGVLKLLMDDLDYAQSTDPAGISKLRTALDEIPLKEEEQKG